MIVEVCQDGRALVPRHPEDALGEAAIYVERFAAGHRVSADDRMFRAWIDPEVGIGAAIRLFPVMDRVQAVQINLHPLGQRLVCRVHTCEQGVAAARRALPDVEDAAHWRFRVTGYITVPALTVGAGTVLVGMDNHQFRIPRRVRRGRVQMQIAEAAPE
jgi:hypothetical protein